MSCRITATRFKALVLWTNGWEQAVYAYRLICETHGAIAGADVPQGSIDYGWLNLGPWIRARMEEHRGKYN